MISLVAIDDDPASLELLTAVLERDGLEIHTSTDPLAGLELVLRSRPEIVLLDLMMPGLDGISLLERIVDYDPGIDVILLTGHYSPQSAVEAIRKGACDYLTKPLDIELIQERIGGLIAEAEKHRRSVTLDRELLNANQMEGMIGRSPVLVEVCARIRRVAPHFRTVLIGGATGTGKELAARALHRLSPGASRNFVTCNCGAIVETLIESELFGHTKGAFTGATQDKVGLFEHANGGTLFLDEIGDMPLATQTRLLRVLQNQEVQRVGSPVSRKVDVRVVAATHRDLRSMVEEGKFREDLYYRLSMFEITLPRLADRKEDLPLLERHFVERFSAQYGKTIRGLTRRAQMVLAKCPWPGNIRELENVIGHACLMTEGEIIDVRDLPERLRETGSNTEDGHGALMSLEDAQRAHVIKVLDALDGNKARAADILGVSRATLYRLLSPEPKAPEPKASPCPAPTGRS